MGRVRNSPLFLQNLDESDRIADFDHQDSGSGEGSESLARTPRPELALAAWPVAYGLVLIFRSPGLALPEVVIALLSKRGAAAPVRRFCLIIGVCSSGLMMLLAFTPLATLYLTRLIGLPPELAHVAAPGIRLSIVVPLLMALQGWQRGRLTHLKVTARLRRPWDRTW